MAVHVRKSSPSNAPSEITLMSPTYAVGTVPNRAFVHAGLAHLPGRDDQTKRRLSRLVVQVLVEQTRSLQIPDRQLCAEIQDIERPSGTRHHLQRPGASSHEPS